MNVQNDSDIPESLLGLMIRFVEKRSPSAKKCKVQVLPAAEGDTDSARFAAEHGVISGSAWKDGGWRREYPQRHFVQVWLPEKYGEKSYPDEFETAGMNVRVLSWDEEFVLVLAHELRHIWQYDTGNHSGTMYDEADELDAELHASKVLEEYRPWRNRYFKPAAEKYYSKNSNVVPLKLSRKTKNVLFSIVALAACTRFYAPESQPVEAGPMMAQVATYEFTAPDFVPTTVVQARKPFIKKARRLAPPPQMPRVKPFFERAVLSMN